MDSLIEDEFDRCLVVDWKSPGREFLDLFADTYPDLAFLAGEAFKAMVDEQANESAEDCLPVLAAYLAQHDHALWNLDPHSDTFALAIVAMADEEAFLAHWQEASGDGGIGIEPERIDAPDDASCGEWLLQGERSARPMLIAQTLAFDDTAPRLDSGLAFDLDQFTPDHEPAASLMLVDLQAWPPSATPALAMLAQFLASRRFAAVHSHGQEHWWVREAHAVGKAKPRRELLRVKSFEPWVADMIQDGTDFPGREWPRVAAHGETVFVVHAERTGARNWHYRVQCHRDYRGETWWEGNPAPTMLALAEDRLLVFEADGTTRLLASGQPAREIALPRGLQQAESPFAPAPDTLVCFTRVKAAHTEGTGCGEDRLRMHRVDLRTGHHQSVVLDAMVCERTLEANAGPFTYRSFGGFLRVHHGHGSWWILNYVSRLFGRKDHAWWWNSETDEVLRFGAHLLPRMEPTFVFHPGSGGYVAQTFSSLHRLVDFETLRPHLQPWSLHWSGA